MKYLKLFEDFISEKTLASQERVLDVVKSPEDDYNEVYAEIEMRMRPSDDSLPYNELEDICINSLQKEPDEESMAYVVNVMHDYLKKRDEGAKDELSDSVKDCIKFFKEDDGDHKHITDVDELKFEEFYDWFTKGGWVDDMIKSYSKKQIRKEFDKQTKDPDQMKLALKEDIVNDNGDSQEEEIEPDYDNDCFIECTGSKFNVSCFGKHIGVFVEQEDADAAIKNCLRGSPNFSPSIWFVSDHGNISSYTLD